MIVVTPCVILEGIAGLRITLKSSCVCVSIKPGHRTRPPASMTTDACHSPQSPTAAMRPSHRATSAEQASPPEPSITRALRIRVSQLRTTGISETRAILHWIIAGRPEIAATQLSPAVENHHMNLDDALQKTATMRTASFQKGLGLFTPGTDAPPIASRGWNLLS